MSGPSRSSPKDAQVMSAILKDMGVLDSESRLINQMLEFTYRYVTDVLEDAKVYSGHANRKNIDSEDIKLAVQMKMDHSFTTPPPRDLLMEIARQKNNQALPLVKPYTGPRLPPDRYCLAQPNYKLKASRKNRTVQYSVPITPRIGMNQQVGPPMSVVTKGLPQPTVTLVNKAGPKPTFRVNPGMGGMSGRPASVLGSSPAMGASGLTRLISGNSTNLNSSLTLPIPPVPAATTTTTQQQPGMVMGAGGVVVGALKRKREDDDDYDM